MSPANSRDLRAEFRARVEELIGRLQEHGVQFAETADRIAHYAAARADALSAAVGEPGFPEAVEAAAQNVALFAGIQAVDAADQADDAVRLAWIESIRFGLSLLAAAIA